MFDFIPCLLSDIEKTNVTYWLAGSLQQVADWCLKTDVLVMISLAGREDRKIPYGPLVDI